MSDPFDPWDERDFDRWTFRRRWAHVGEVLSMSENEVKALDGVYGPPNSHILDALAYAMMPRLYGKSMWLSIGASIRSQRRR